MATHKKAEGALERYSRLLGIPEIGRAELRLCSLTKSTKKLSQVEKCITIVEMAINIFGIEAEDFFNLKKISREISGCRRAAIVLMDRETYLHRKEIALFLGSAPTQISATIKSHKEANEVKHSYSEYFEKFDALDVTLEKEKETANG